jgi:hypothetical protein
MEMSLYIHSPIAVKSNDTCGENIHTDYILQCSTVLPPQPISQTLTIHILSNHSLF